MKSFSKKLSFILVVLILPVLIFTGCTRGELVSSGVKDELYYINNYDIQIEVDEYRNCLITERIKVEFLTSSAGITRRIPEAHEIYREDGTTDRINSKVENFKIISNGASENRIYDTYKSGLYYVVELGFDYKKSQTTHNYYFSYEYNLGNDNTDDYDEFYFNIIGTGWDCEIYNITFDVTLPKSYEFDYDTLGATYGEYGSTNTLFDNINATFGFENVNDKCVISGSIDYLDAFEGLTLRAQMTDGYFEYYVDIFGIIHLVGSILLGLILIIICIILWKKYGKDHELVKPVMFYPPKGMNTIDLELNYKLKNTTKGVVSLIVWLASKGYIKIEENNQDSCLIHKIKDYDGDDSREKMLMETLFSSSNVVESNNLGSKLYDYTQTIFSTGKIKKEKFYDKSGESKIKKIATFIFFSLALILISPMIKIYGLDIVYMICGLITSVVSYAFVTSAYRIEGGGKRLTLMLSIIVLYLVSYAFFYYTIFAYETDYTIGIMIYLICLLVAIFILSFMSRRTAENVKVYGEILGFRDFLINVEKEKLELLINDDPHYFFNILPYTYVLNISDKWIKKLDYLHIETPDWYVSTTGTYITFYSINRIARNTSNYIHSRQVSERMRSSSGGRSGSGRSGRSGGFGGGGGFSGGGSGGGGGSRR